MRLQNTLKQRSVSPAKKRTVFSKHTAWFVGVLATRHDYESACWAAERFVTWSGVALCRSCTRVPEEVAQREGVDAFGGEDARERMALVVKPEPAVNAGDCFRDLEVPHDRRLAVRSSFRCEEDVLADDHALTTHRECVVESWRDRDRDRAFRLSHHKTDDACSSDN